MGSFFAGIKAGTLGGILYVAGMAAFNVAILYALKADALVSINHSFPAACPLVPNVNGSVQDCFDSVVALDVPLRAVVVFFVALLYSGLFGMYHDYLPRLGTFPKAETAAAIMGTNLVLFWFPGYIFDSQSAAATSVFLVCWTGVFGYLLGRLYRRYTRAVTFDSQDPSMLRVLVDRRDLTGKSWTFATTSTHRVRAEVAEDASFKEWEASGGVALEDPRSFETSIEVKDAGALKGKVTGKY